MCIDFDIKMFQSQDLFCTLNTNYIRHQVSDIICNNRTKQVFTIILLLVLLTKFICCIVKKVLS